MTVVAESTQLIPIDAINSTLNIPAVENKLEKLVPELKTISFIFQE